MGEVSELGELLCLKSCPPGVSGRCLGGRVVPVRVEIARPEPDTYVRVRPHGDRCAWTRFDVQTRYRVTWRIDG